jgi:peptide/nickel transport system permease protein
VGQSEEPGQLTTRAGLLLVLTLSLAGVFAPQLALHDAARTYRDNVLAPPMPVRLHDASGRWSGPVVYPLRLVDRLSRTYALDVSAPVPAWSAIRGEGVSWHPLGTDSLGRDVWSRLVLGTRVSLGLALVSLAGALLIGVCVGGIAGQSGGRVDVVLMRVCEFVMVLPTIYVVLALRAALPPVLPFPVTFAAMAVVLAVAGAPQVARAVRSVVVGERTRDYVEAARAAGAGPMRVLARHLLPACTGVVVAQALLLLPAFILAESTLSFIGLGFEPAVASWGTMLQEAANVRAVAEYPWVLAPAVGISLSVLAFNLVAEGGDAPRLP